MALCAGRAAVPSGRCSFRFAPSEFAVTFNFGEYSVYLRLASCPLRSLTESVFLAHSSSKGLLPSLHWRPGGVPIATVIDRSQLRLMSTDHDAKIGLPEYVGITTASGQPFSANTLINDARQRWLFRMIHSQRPLEEKMALFWHNHFATAYSKVAGTAGQERATRMMDNDPNSLAGSEPGQIHKLRQLATGSFPTLLMTMCERPRISTGSTAANTRTRPKEIWPRDHAVQLRRRQLTESTLSARACSPLQLADRRDRTVQQRPLVRIPVSSRRSRCCRQDLHLSDLSDALAPST